MIEPLFSVATNSGSDMRTLQLLTPAMISVFPRADINETEKLIWLWLTLHCAQTHSKSCAFSYQHLADVMQRKPDAIHRAVLRLRSWGFLFVDLPYLQGIVTLREALAVRVFSPTLPEIQEAKKREITINQIRDEMRKKNASSNTIK